MSKKLLIYSMALILIMPWQPLIAKDKKIHRRQPSSKITHDSSVLETQIRKKYDEIEKLKFDNAQANYGFEAKIRKKYEELDKLKGNSDAGYNARISYP